MSVKIYHNPRCSKSRETLALLEEKGIQPTIDELYQSLGLDNPALTKDELLKAISENSALLERPIVVNGKKAKIGRPPESVLAIL